MKPDRAFIDLFSYRGLKIETPFERELRQRAADREVREQSREHDIALNSKLMELKYKTYLAQEKAYKKSWLLRNFFIKKPSA